MQSACWALRSSCRLSLYRTSLVGTSLINMKRGGGQPSAGQRSIGDFFPSNGPKRQKSDGVAKENKLPAPASMPRPQPGSPPKGPVRRRRSPVPIVHSPTRQQQPVQQEQQQLPTTQQPPAGTSNPSAAPWDSLVADTNAGPLLAAPSSAAATAPQTAAAITTQAGAATSAAAAAVAAGSAAPPEASGSTAGGSSSGSAARGAPQAGGLGALMTAAKAQAKVAKAGPAKALTPEEMGAVAARNQQAVQEALQAAGRDGRQPQLAELLTEPSWKQVLAPEFSKGYMEQLQTFVEKEWASSTVYPPQDSIFRAFNSVPFDQVRVVVLGQDPYFNPGEAMGLSFSVPLGIKIPSSLRNIYKELATDVGCKVPNHGNLEKWCRQGVLLLNASLTVRAGSPNSHSQAGWGHLTAAAVAALSQRRSGLVFLLWGKFAQDRGKVVDASRHHVLKAAHPSGLSASRGFFSCRHFSQTNQLLQRAGLPPIDWQID